MAEIALLGNERFHNKKVNDMTGNWRIAKNEIRWVRETLFQFHEQTQHKAFYRNDCGGWGRAYRKMLQGICNTYTEEFEAIRDMNRC